MFKRFGVFGLVLLLSGSHWAACAQEQQNLTAKELATDAAIISAIIAASIAAYRQGGPGPCACPDDVDRVGHRCGKRSAHDRPGGWVVHCSAADVTADMIKAFRASRMAASMK